MATLHHHNETSSNTNRPHIILIKPFDSPTKRINSQTPRNDSRAINGLTNPSTVRPPLSRRIEICFSNEREKEQRRRYFLRWSANKHGVIFGEKYWQFRADQVVKFDEHVYFMRLWNDPEVVGWQPCEEIRCSCVSRFFQYVCIILSFCAGAF